MRQNYHHRNGSINTASSTMVSVWSWVISPVWMLLSFCSGIITQNCSDFNPTETIRHHQIHQGLSTNITCHYNKTRNQSLTVTLRRKNKLCEYRYFHTSWNKSHCNDNITFIWSPETEEISFQLIDLQINNSGIYTCTVEKHIPPPTKCLGEKKIFIHVKAPPSVSVSCEKRPDGAPTVLCASEGFYPADLKQVWLRDGEYISYLNTSHALLYQENLNSSDVSWNYSKNKDGSHSVTSYLHLRSNIAKQVMLICRVNHSALSKPITVNISSTECTEREEELAGMYIPTVIICGVTISIGLILAGCYRCLRRRRPYLHTIVEAPSLSEPVSHSTLRTMGDHQSDSQVYSNLSNQPAVSQVYSTLGYHMPVPCRNNSSDSTVPSL